MIKFMFKCISGFVAMGSLVFALTLLAINSIKIEMFAMMTDELNARWIMSAETAMYVSFATFFVMMVVFNLSKGGKQ